MWRRVSFICLAVLAALATIAGVLALVAPVPAPIFWILLVATVAAFGVYVVAVLRDRSQSREQPKPQSHFIIGDVGEKSRVVGNESSADVFVRGRVDGELRRNRHRPKDERSR